MVLEYESLRYTPDGSAKFVFWASGDDYPKFEKAMESDPTIREFARLTEVGSTRLYRVTFTEAGQRALTYPVVTEQDMAFLNITLTETGSEIRARIPSREALFTYREACNERDIPFRLNRIFREEQINRRDKGSYRNVTEAQQDALVLALERGYFEIPRETTLEEIAKELEISTQALSTRLRRGITNLIGNTVTTETI
jgi:predicted DNA binding protein